MKFYLGSFYWYGSKMAKRELSNTNSSSRASLSSSEMGTTDFVSPKVVIVLMGTNLVTASRAVIPPFVQSYSFPYDLPFLFRGIRIVD